MTRNVLTKWLAIASLAVLPIGAVSADAALEKIITSPHRAVGNIERDQYRHPSETLTFFGIQANMAVAEIWPGRGWYTEILAPWLKQGGGTLIAAGFPQSSGPEFRQTILKNYDAMLAANPAYYNEVVITEFGSGYTDFVEANSLDAIVTFRNVHNWAMANFADEAFSAFYTALKPGGILGITDHRARIGTPAAENLQSGYLTENYVIALAEKAGFILDERSEINANPADTTDHPNGVWTLPPTLRIDADQQAKYLAIGESDRMTLRFIKPKD